MTVTSAPRPARLPPAAILIIALAAGLGLWAGQRWFSNAPPVLQNTQLYPQPRELPPFSLDGPDDAAITADSLRGRWTLAFLGFTHCPDICPTTLADLGAAERLLSDLPVERRPRILFLSADPERDTPDATAKYARYFSPDALGATAAHDRLEPFARSLGMVYMKTALEGDNYTIDHSSSIALIDEQVRLVGLIRPPLDPARIAADLRAVTAR